MSELYTVVMVMMNVTVSVVCNCVIIITYFAH